MIMKILVKLLDDCSMSVEINEHTTGEQLTLSVCRALGVHDRQYFSCCQTTKHGFDIWLRPADRVLTQINDDRKHLVFKVKFYPTNPTTITDDVSRHQVYLQMRQDVVTGRLPCSRVTLALLGAYAVQATLGDYDTEVHGSGTEYIRDIQLAPFNSPELMRDVVDQHATLRGRAKEDVELDYIAKCKEMAMYGQHVFNAKNEQKQRICIGVGAEGLVVMEGSVRLTTLRWAKIIKFSYRANRFIVHTRPSPDIEHPTAKELTFSYTVGGFLTRSRVTRLFTVTSEHHAFHRLHMLHGAPIDVADCVEYVNIPAVICTNSERHYEGLPFDPQQQDASPRVYETIQLPPTRPSVEPNDANSTYANVDVINRIGRRSASDASWS